MSSNRTVGSLVDALDARFPAAWAEPWDNVGLVFGTRSAAIEGVLVTLDATAEAVERAVDAGANVLVTHHPPFLDPPQSFARAAGAAGTLEAALRHGTAVVSLHTNLDRSPEGATALCDALGLRAVAPLESSTERVAVVVTYVPADAVEAVRDAMAAAGAGRIGEYERCAFTVQGVGHFDAREAASPVVADGGGGVAEVRIEMVAPLDSANAVVNAARDAHPYEEPVVLATEGVRARGAARLGRLCEWRESATLGELAEHASGILGGGCRVWGDPQRHVRRIAVGNGSGGSLIPDAIRVADTLLVGEVRYHDALTAAAAGLGVIEAGHDATEWPLVRVLGDAIAAWDPEVRCVTERASLGWRMMEGPDVRR